MGPIARWLPGLSALIISSFESTGKAIVGSDSMRCVKYGNDMQNALIVVANPDPKSFNHALAYTVARAWSQLRINTVIRDLHAERFDPLLTLREIRGESSTDPGVQDHIKLLVNANLLCVVHPNCWGAPPAIMKGWMDRVFALNSAYSFEKGADHGDPPRGLLRVRAALVLNTSNTSYERETACFGDPLERIWHDCILGYCGVSHVTRRVFRVVSTSTVQERTAWLQQASGLAVQLAANVAPREAT